MEEPKFENIYDFNCLYMAAEKTLSKARYACAGMRFYSNLEANLVQIQKELQTKTYEFGNYREFYTADLKPRLISAPPLRDRVVQSAICEEIEPYIDARLDYDSYACRKGKGTHRAAERAAYLCKKFTHYAYFDISKFFDSINIARLEEIYRQRFIKDQSIMELLHAIFINKTNGVGVKKGCRTSQLSANVYLNELDLFVRHTLKPGGYVRYMDDFIVFDNDISVIHKAFECIPQFLENNLLLSVNDKCHIGQTKDGFTFVGFHIFEGYRLVKQRVLNASLKATTQWKKGKINNEEFYRGIASRVGHCQGTSSYKWQALWLLKVLKMAFLDHVGLLQMGTKIHI